jgi:hypothetical protein
LNFSTSGTSRRWPNRSSGGLRLSVKSGGADGGQLLRGDFIDKPRGVVLQPGKARDLVDTFWGSVFLMSERMVAELAKVRLTGRTARHVDIPESPELPPLSLLTVTGRSGSAYSRTGLNVAGLPEFGWFLDPRQWDGSDFFVPENLNGVFLASAAAASVRTMRLSNVRLDPANFEPLPDLPS